MSYFWFKAFHIIAVVAWMAGLFYLPRLFVYHAEVLLRPEPERTVLSAQFKIMERRLYRGITTPAMIAALALGLGLTAQPQLWPEVWKMPWLEAKAGLVLLLVIYHLVCGEAVRLFASDECRWSSGFFRVFNEFPTLLLVAIVLLAVFKDALPGGALATVLVTLTLLLGLGMAVYSRIRRR